jgi:hypothetical protein
MKGPPPLLPIAFGLAVSLSVAVRAAEPAESTPASAESHPILNLRRNVPAAAPSAPRSMSRQMAELLKSARKSAIPAFDVGRIRSPQPVFHSAFIILH